MFGMKRWRAIRGGNVIAANECVGNRRGVSVGGRSQEVTAHGNFFFNNICRESRLDGIWAGNTFATSNYFSQCVVGQNLKNPFLKPEYAYVLNDNTFWQPPKGPADTLVDWESFLQKNDLVWDEGIGDTWGDSAFIANGLTGASIYGLPGDEWTLRWELGRTDVAAEYSIPKVDWSIPRVPIGNVLLKPSGMVQQSDMRLDLWNAEARGSITTDKGAIAWRSFIERESNVVVIETKSTDQEKELALSLAEQWAISGRISHTNTDPLSLDPKHLPPKPYREQVGGSCGGYPTFGGAWSACYGFCEPKRLGREKHVSAGGR